MNATTDNPGTIDLYGLISSIFNRTNNKLLPVIIYCLFVANSNLFCQPATRSFFTKRINFICATNNVSKHKLRDLLLLQQQMKMHALESDSCFMFLLQKTGVQNYKEGNLPAAINFTKQSIKIAQACVDNRSCSLLALVNNYFNLEYYYDETKQYQEKYAAIDSCIMYALKGSCGYDKALAVLIDKTEYLFNKGDYNGCTKSAKLGEEITQKFYHRKDSIQYIVSFVNKQAYSLYYSNNIMAAQELLEHKITQFKQKNDTNELYAFYNLLGTLNGEKRNYARSLNYYLTAYQLNKTNKFIKGSIQNLTNIGKLYANHFNQYETGLNYCYLALKHADSSESLVVLKQIGNIYVLKKKFDSAQYFFQRAYNTVQPLMNETTMLKSSFQFPGFNLLQNLSDLTTSKGDAFVQQYYFSRKEMYLKKALEIYKKNDLFLAKIKIEQQLQFSSNLVWRATARNLYEHAIEACYANNNITDAFYFFEKSRAILLNDQINEQQWMADTDIAKQAVIKKEITELERKITALPPSSDEYLSTQTKVYSAYEAFNLLSNKLKSKNPAYYKNYLDTSFISILQLKRDILKNSTTLLEIFCGDSAVYVLRISAANQALTKIDPQLYDSVTNAFTTFVTSPAKLNKNYPGFIKAAQQLYGLLFSTNLTSYGRLIISPDGKSFPFEALVANENQQQPEYLLNRSAISYTYSVKYLTNQFAINHNKNITVLGFAPVTYNNYKGLSTLTGSDISLQNINTYFGNAANYVFEKATKNNFLQNFPGYNIIQLYTHAADSSDNNDPVIYFADSAFYLSDLITDRKCITQLVVLSACETANGKLYEGEGIFSFNRGFAALGIPAAVSNLWPVDNESTYQLTELFYKYLSEGLPTDIALQKAKIAFISTRASKEKTLPYYWAGTILTGKVNSITDETYMSWKAIIATLLAILAGGYLAKRYRQKQDKKIFDSLV